MCSNALFPFITQPTRVTSRSKTLIDNIFINFYSQDIISGNLTISISDHMAQFIQIPNKEVLNKPNKILRCYKNFNDSFTEDISKVDWPNIIEENDNPNLSTARFIKVFDSVLDKHAPLKYLTKKQLKSHDKPWITKGILKSTEIKDNTYKKYLNTNTGIVKDNLFAKFKSYRNTISNLLSKGKKIYINFFQDNLNDLKNTWKGIKEIFSINTAKSKQKINLSLNKKIISDSQKIALMTSFQQLPTNSPKKLFPQGTLSMIF